MTGCERPPHLGVQVDPIDDWQCVPAGKGDVDPGLKARDKVRVKLLRISTKGDNARALGDGRGECAVLQALDRSAPHECNDVILDDGPQRHWPLLATVYLPPTEPAPPAGGSMRRRLN